MKKLSLCMVSAALALLNYSHASAEPFMGLYTGVLAGGSFLSGTEHSSFNRPVDFGGGLFDGSLSLNNHHGIKDNSFMGMVVLGYGEVFENNGYLGGELFVDWTNHNPTTTRVNGTNSGAASAISFNYSSRVKVEPVSYGIDLRPGYQLGECSLIYGRVGVGVKRITHYINTAETFIGGVNINGTFSQGITRGVMRFGLGFEQAITDYLSFRIDYIYSYLGTLNGATSGSAIVDFLPPYLDTLVTTNGQAKKQLYINSVLFGLSWYW